MVFHRKFCFLSNPIYFAIMKTIEKFEMLCVILNKKTTEQLQSLDFETLCKENDADFTEMDNLFFMKFGISGDDYLSIV